MGEYDGGPAFPSVWDFGPGERGGVDGMSLRDYFAAHAMNGLINRGFTEFGNKSKDYAQLAYEYADAMLKAREL